MFSISVSLLFVLARFFCVIEASTADIALSLARRASSPVDFTGAEWIWTTNATLGETVGAHRAFRKALIPSSSNVPVSAEILIQADDHYALYFNGNPLANTLNSGQPYQSVAQRYCVQLASPLQPTPYVIAVHGANLDGNGPAGLLIAIQVTFQDGTTTKFLTDASWKASLNVPAGFEQPGFDDSTWNSAIVEGTYPSASPWGQVTAASTCTPVAIAAPSLTVTSSTPSRSATTSSMSSLSATTSLASSTSSPNSVGSTGKHNGKKTGAIVGGSVGGAAAIAAAILALLSAKHIKYVLGSLASALFGIFLFRSRRMVFLVDDDLGQTQISLFLTPHKAISDTSKEANEKILVWKVFDVGGAQRHFEVTVPCTYKEGSPDIGFGTIMDKGYSVECINYLPAPAYLDEEDIWRADEETGEMNPTNNRRPKLRARNRSVQGSRIAVGTIGDDNMNPFLLLEKDAFSPHEDGPFYHAEGDLYLHVFRTNGYSPGNYKDTIVKNVESDRLSPLDGIKIKSLLPLTTWRIRSAGQGKLKLEITHNRKEDVRRYKHECMIKKDARAPPA